MMKPVMHLYASKIWNPLKVIFPEFTLLNLISHLENNLLGIGKSSHHSLTIRMLIISGHELYSSLSS